MLTVTLINIVVVALAVLIHYECLAGMNRFLCHFHAKPRVRIVMGVLGVLIAHCIEVWIFALGYYVMHGQPGWGVLEGNYNGTILDSVYFSFTTFTTVGFGDIEPIGAVRFLTGIESLTGLVLITWSASYLYLEMQSSWDSIRETK